MSPSGCATATCIQHHPCTTTKTGCQLADQKANFRLIIYSRSSANRENLAEIGLVDFEIIDLTGIVKMKRKQAEHIAHCACFQQPGRLNNCTVLALICTCNDCRSLTDCLLVAAALRFTAHYRRPSSTEHRST